MNLNLIKVYEEARFGKDTFAYYIKRAIVELTPGLKKKVRAIISTRQVLCGKVELAFLGKTGTDLFAEQNGEKVEALNKTLHQPTLIFCYADAVDSLGNNPCRQHENLYNMAQLNHCVVDLGGIKIGCEVFDLNQAETDCSCFAVLKKRETLKRNGANFTIAYVKHNDSANKAADKIKQDIGMWGFDCVIGTAEEIKMNGILTRKDFNATRVLNGIGPMHVNLQQANGQRIDQRLTVVLRASIGCNPQSGKVDIVREGYLSFLIKEESLIEINKAHGFDDDLRRECYLYIEDMMHGMRNWNELITLQDIVDVLGETLPDKYSYLSEYTVNQICARTYDLGPGSVFFFLPSFNDKNDKEVESELLRLRFMIRAHSRKSLFMFSYKKSLGRLPHLVIDDTREAHIRVMAWYKKNFLPAEFVGVTGSVGKTSTKDMLQCVMNEGFQTQSNLRNTNVQVKIGINMQDIRSDCQMYIQEIGGGRPGGASRHSRMCMPSAAIITNIGTAHIGNFNSQEELMENKLGIVDGLDQDGMLFLNGDDDLLLTVKPACKVTYFALHNTTADYCAYNIEEVNGGMEFDVVHAGDRVHVEIDVLGEHNVLNAVCAFAVAKHFGMADQDIKRGLKCFRTTGIRQNVITAGQYKFFVDCYNSSLDSIKSSLSTLSKLIPAEGGRRIAIIGDVTGMGELQGDINDHIVEVIGNCDADKVVCYGDNANYITSCLKKRGREVECINEAGALEAWMVTHINRGDVTLLKGSSKVKFADRLDTAFGFDLADQNYIDRSQSSTIREHHLLYRMFHDYASAKRYEGQDEKVVMPDKVLKRNVKKILKGAFAENKTLREIVIGAKVAHVGEKAFANCRSLEKVEFPDATRYIGSEAFQNCHGLRQIALGNAIVHVDETAFNGCDHLERIILPKTMNHLQQGYFVDCGAELIFV